MYAEGFASKLKQARNNTGFTQREIEKETKIPQSTLANSASINSYKSKLSIG